MPGFYKGQYSVLEDGDGAVIPIILNPADIPADGLVIDVSSAEQSPAGSSGGNFFINGLTVDATAANTAAGVVSIQFFGGSNLIRNANGGTTQVYRVSGYCQSILIKKLAWTSGSINFVLWNTSPPNELQSPLNVIASGSVSISGTPNVNVAGGSVAISSGNVTINNAAVTINLQQNNQAANFNVDLSTNAILTLVPFIPSTSIICIGFIVQVSSAGVGSCNFRIGDVSGAPVTDYQTVMAASSALASMQIVGSISNVAIAHPVGFGIGIVVSGTSFPAGSNAIVNYYYRTQ